MPIWKERRVDFFPPSSTKTDKTKNIFKVIDTLKKRLVERTDESIVVAKIDVLMTDTLITSTMLMVKL